MKDYHNQTELDAMVHIEKGLTMLTDYRHVIEEEIDALKARNEELCEVIKAAQELMGEIILEFPEHKNRFNGTWASYQGQFREALAKNEAKP